MIPIPAIARKGPSLTRDCDEIRMWLKRYEASLLVVETVGVYNHEVAELELAELVTLADGIQGLTESMRDGWTLDYGDNSGG